MIELSHKNGTYEREFLSIKELQWSNLKNKPTLSPNGNLVIIIIRDPLIPARRQDPVIIKTKQNKTSKKQQQKKKPAVL